MQQCKMAFGIPMGATQKCAKWGGIMHKEHFLCQQSSYINK